jgi:hypothetical protein
MITMLKALVAAAGAMALAAAAQEPKPKVEAYKPSVVRASDVVPQQVTAPCRAGACQQVDRLDHPFPVEGEVAHRGKVVQKSILVARGFQFFPGTAQLVDLRLQLNLLGRNFSPILHKIISLLQPGPALACGTTAPEV